MNSHPTAVLQRPFRDAKLKVTFPWMYNQRDGKFTIRNKNPDTNTNCILSFFFFSFLLVIIGNRKRHLVSASIKVKSVLGCFWFGFQGFGYHLVFCVWGPIDRTLLLTNILLQPCWVMANSPSNKLKHFLGAHNYVLGDTRKIFFNFLQKLLALPLYHT